MEATGAPGKLSTLKRLVEPEYAQLVPPKCALFTACGTSAAGSKWRICWRDLFFAPLGVRRAKCGTF